MAKALNIKRRRYLPFAILLLFFIISVPGCITMETGGNPYLKNDGLWAMWQESGVTETTLIVVEFQFACDNEEAAKEFTGLLENQGYEPVLSEYNETWNISISLPPQTWTLDKLNRQAKEFSDLAEDHDCSIDGIGSMMPE